MEFAMTFALIVVLIITQNVCFALVIAQSEPILHNVWFIKKNITYKIEFYFQN
jgi:uncharacterized membrane protein